jgi:hypothetical protein
VGHEEFEEVREIMLLAICFQFKFTKLPFATFQLKSTL